MLAASALKPVLPTPVPAPAPAPAPEPALTDADAANESGEWDGDERVGESRCAGESECAGECAGDTCPDDTCRRVGELEFRMMIWPSMAPLRRYWSGRRRGVGRVSPLRPSNELGSRARSLRAWGATRCGTPSHMRSKQLDVAGPWPVRKSFSWRNELPAPCHI